MRGECNRTLSQKYKEFYSLWKDYSKVLIMKKLCITEKVYIQFLAKAIKQTRIAKTHPIQNKTKEPFSFNEDDYGIKHPYPLKLENSKIINPPLTELQIAIKRYKVTWNI